MQTVPRRVLLPARLAPAPPPSPGHRTLAIGGETMGTTWSAKLVLPQPMPAARLEAEIAVLLDRVVAEMSPWRDDSDISRFNRAPADAWQALPGDFYAVLDHALAMARATSGAYDPTIGALVDLWGFGPAPRRATPPADWEIGEALMLQGWARVILDPPRRAALQPGGVRLDLSSIAKGHAVDLVSERLRALGVASHLVEIGGELRGEGLKTDGQPWWVALEDPPGARPGAQTVVALHGLSIATSGDYRRYFEHGGRRYAHTLDPRTGRPVAGDLVSVTVVAERCLQADALATALTVLGVEAGIDFARQHGVAARFVRDDQKQRPEEFLSPAFAAMLD